MRIRDSGISPNWLEQLIGPGLSAGSALSRTGCGQNAGYRRLFLLSLFREQASIRRGAHPPWQQEGFTLCYLYPVGNVSVILRKRGFHSQILIQGPFQYHFPRWGNTPCTTQSPALGVRNAALYVVSMIHDL